MLQVWVGVVPVGPKGTALNSSYNNRDSREYKEDLGYAVVNFARMVPDGLLVFFPSYGVLKSCTDFWKNTSVGGTGMAAAVTDQSPAQVTEQNAVDASCVILTAESGNGSSKAFHFIHWVHECNHFIKATTSCCPFACAMVAV